MEFEVNYCGERFKPISNHSTYNWDSKPTSSLQFVTDYFKIKCCFPQANNQSREHPLRGTFFTYCAQNLGDDQFNYVYFRAEVGILNYYPTSVCLLLQSPHLCVSQNTCRVGRAQLSSTIPAPNKGYRAVR